MKKFALSLTLLLVLSLFGCRGETPASSAEEKTVGILINCQTAVEYGKEGLPDDGILLSEKVSLPGDKSAFDALKKALEDNGLALEARGGYVKSIAGLGEGDCGKSSGWMYRIKGEFPNRSCDKYIPEDGDVIEFVYSVEYGDIM